MSKKKGSKRAKPIEPKPKPAAAPPADVRAIDAALARAGQLHNSGQLAAAAAIYHDVLRVAPDHGRALFLLGVIVFQHNRFAEARAMFERATVLEPKLAPPQLLLGLTLRVLGELPAALSALRRARELDHGLLDAWQTEAALAQQMGDLSGAQSALEQALALAPRLAPLHAALGELHLAAERWPEAELALAHASRLDPYLIEPILNLGVLHERRGDTTRAREQYRAALAISDASAQAHFNLGCIEQKLGLLQSAAEHFRRALMLAPGHLGAVTNLAGALHELGQNPTAFACYRFVLGRAPTPELHSSLIALSLYEPSISAREIVVEARRWGERYACPEAARAPRKRRAKRSGAIRVGYVSPDFRQHSVAYFFEPLLAAHDRERFEITCYSNVEHSDATTERMAVTARMVAIRGRSDAEVAEQIRADGIDVLVDLAGHTAGNRLALFGYRAAPIQATYLGYPSTSGVPAIEYRFTDALADPAPAADRQYTERLVRLPRGFCCFRAPAAAPAVAELPALARGDITFGSLNNFTKLTTQVLAIWAQLLRALPRSRLVLQSRPFADPDTCRALKARFFALGVEAERVQLHGPMPLEEHLALYHQIDVGLDTLPWNGHTTTCLALHMGVPVVTVAGGSCAGRMGLSVLTQAELSEWVTVDERGYVEAALALARDLPALADLRRGLRSRLELSPLCDAASLARDLEDAYASLIERAAI